MSLSPREIAQLRKIVSIAEALLTTTTGSKGSRAKTAASSSAKTTADAGRRRTGKELAAFRKMILAERKKGTPVAEIARKHGITPNYIYQMR